MSKQNFLDSLHKRLGYWEIVLLVLGSPIWLSLLIAALAVVIALYISLWSVIVSLWAGFAAIIGASLGTLITGISYELDSFFFGGVAMFGISSVCAGLAIFAFFACKAATNGILLLTKKMVSWMKSRLSRKENACE